MTTTGVGPDVPPADRLPVERVMCPHDLTTVLVGATARALAGRDCGDLPGRIRARLPLRGQRPRGTRAGTIAADRLGDVDAESVADWMIAQYPRRRYPVVVLGSPSGAAAHLAVALGAPWLPAGFHLAVRWPDARPDEPTKAMAYAAGVLDPFVHHNPGIRVRQVHDGVGARAAAGATIDLHVHWTAPPAAYQRFIRDCGAGAVLLVRDTATWPVTTVSDRHSLQVGTPAHGLGPADYYGCGQRMRIFLAGLGAPVTQWELPEPHGTAPEATRGVDSDFVTALDRWGAVEGVEVHELTTSGPSPLSAVVADLYRDWLRSASKAGDKVAVETGHVIDPWHVLRAGLVPYWCPNSLRSSVADAAWWLAGSEPFASIDIILDAPGVPLPDLAELGNWQALSAFAERRGTLDARTGRAYPNGAVGPRDATVVLRRQPYDLPTPPSLPLADALASIGTIGARSGVTVT